MVTQLNDQLSVNSNQDEEEVENLKAAHEEVSATQAMQLLLKYKKELDKAGLATHQFDKKLEPEHLKSLYRVFEKSLGEDLA